MGKFAKLVDTEEKIVQFKSRYGIPEDVHIRYVPYGDLALLQRQDLVLPIVVIVEGGVRIPMHTFLLRFLAHFKLNPLQCASNVFRIVMGTAVLMEKLGLNLTVHDITYVYSLQTTGRDQYTLVARNADRKLVNCVPLSEMIVLGIPNLVIIFFQTNLIESLSLMFASGSTSTHFVK
jgi:hypothetical protein